MSGLKKSLALDPADVRLIELIAGMTARSRRPAPAFEASVGRNTLNDGGDAVSVGPATDGAGETHRAWTRGRDHGVEATVAAVNLVLDGIERGEAANGHFDDAGLEALTDRLRRMVASRL